MRVLAIITYAVAGVFGIVAFVFGSAGIGMTAVYVLLFAIAFHRIAALQRQLPPSRAPFPRPSDALQIALFSFALLAVVALFVSRRPELGILAMYLGLFGCLFRGLASLRDRVGRADDDLPRIPDET
jgi:hypothetical protein